MNANIIVHGGWLDDRFFIWGEKVPRSRFDQIVNFQYPFLYSPFELKLALFRHDPETFYGTFVDIEKAVLDVPLLKRMFESTAGEVTVYQAEEQMTHYSFPLEGIVLSIDQLIRHWNTFLTWEKEEDFHLAEDMTYWLSVFKSVQYEISAGHFLPEPTGQWNVSSFPFKKWLKALPESSMSLRPNTSYIQREQVNISLEERFKKAVIQTSDAAIRHLLTHDEVTNQFRLWEQSVDSSLRPVVRRLIKPEMIETSISAQAFQQQLGTVTVQPFKSGLALHEPNSPEDPWKLTLCVIDRKRPSHIVEMVDLERGEHPWRSNPIAQLKQDVQQAKQLIHILSSLSLATPELSLSPDEAYELFTTHDQTLKDIGFHLIIPKWVHEKRRVRIELNMEEQQPPAGYSEPLLDWQSLASFTYNIAIGDATLSVEEFESYVEGHRPFIYSNGQWIAWDPTLASQLRSYLDQLDQKTSYLEAWKLDQEEGPEHIDIGWDVNWGRELAQSLEAIYSQSPPLINLPKRFHGELRPYQHEGVSWLAHLRRTGFGGCLADDMGLGKSIQTIVYILYVLEAQKRDGEPSKPFLLICPTSLLYNWLQECETFAPDLKVFVHHGQTRVQDIDEFTLSEWDLVLTSYQLAVRDEELFSNLTWNGLILDEAQHIKNVETKQRRAIKAIHAKHRVALTGTPIENKLKELWSLMDVLNPTYLGSFRHFQEQFIRPIERDQDNKRLEQLQQLIHPFILRRKKSDESLQLGLPEKREHVHKVHLSVEQAALYQAVVDDVLSQLEQVSQFERRALILRSLTKLKQICNHPAHFLKDRDIEGHQSEKWDALLELTDDIHAHNEKVLIFTQYKEMGSLITTELEKRFNQPVPFLHGSLTRSKRQEAILTFQENKQIPVFVLSLKAGGVGLNLTAANHVIHYDRWWNPAVENQATDRAFRIGQTQDVTVHKLMTRGTLEERIDRMLTQKQALADQILAAGEQRVTELSNDEIYELIRLTTTVKG
ncbi:DEAD/DEAH box helicase [Halalkalibacter urbisdiaboli]|uniref:DEAD/DEAH box helicase n=1 Tax=Halalkalibacter urbisdiaboli TaxID=1960589 RepID=UPI000B44621D|nr:DEAD/DEAH box helicase [Halalkalibacter urbisdiaboli]